MTIATVIDTDAGLFAPTLIYSMVDSKGQLLVLEGWQVGSLALRHLGPEEMRINADGSKNSVAGYWAIEHWPSQHTVTGFKTLRCALVAIDELALSAPVNAMTVQQGQAWMVPHAGWLNVIGAIDLSAHALTCPIPSRREYEAYLAYAVPRGSVGARCVGLLDWLLDERENAARERGI